MTLRDYGGRSSEVSGVTTVEVIVGSKTLPTTFFVIEGKGSYSALLGRDWIHANCCVPFYYASVFSPMGWRPGGNRAS